MTTVVGQLDSTTVDSNLSTLAAATHYYYSDAITGSTIVSTSDSVDGPRKKAQNDSTALAVHYCGQSLTTPIASSRCSHFVAENWRTVKSFGAGRQRKRLNQAETATEYGERQ